MPEQKSHMAQGIEKLISTINEKGDHENFLYLFFLFLFLWETNHKSQLKPYFLTKHHIHQLRKPLKQQNEYFTN